VPHLFLGAARVRARRSARRLDTEHAALAVSRRRLGSAAVRTREDLEQVAVGVAEVQAAASVVTIDLAAPRAARVGPIFDAALADASEDRVEVVLIDQKGIVLRRDLTVAVVEVERYAILELDDQERTEARGARPPENLGEEGRRLFLVTAPDDRV